MPGTMEPSAATKLKVIARSRVGIMRNFSVRFRGYCWWCGFGVIALIMIIVPGGFSPERIASAHSFGLGLGLRERRDGGA